jgi:hypothetical protein
LVGSRSLGWIEITLFSRQPKAQNRNVLRVNSETYSTLFSSVIRGCSGEPDIRCPIRKKVPLEWRGLAWKTIFYGSLSLQKPSPGSKRTVPH